MYIPSLSRRCSKSSLKIISSSEPRPMGRTMRALRSLRMSRDPCEASGFICRRADRSQKLRQCVCTPFFLSDSISFEVHQDSSSRVRIPIFKLKHHTSTVECISEIQGKISATALHGPASAPLIVMGAYMK